MINCAVIIPTGDELIEGIILDTDSPMIMEQLLRINGNCKIMRHPPVSDRENLISQCILTNARGTDLIVLVGGSGGGHRHSSTLGKDYTHSALEVLLEEKNTTELYGKNGHMWCKLLCGVIKNTLVINVPGPYQEAKAAIKAFCTAYEKNPKDLKQINLAMMKAVKEQYGA